MAIPETRSAMDYLENPELIDRLCKGPNFQNEEAELVLYKCNRLILNAKKTKKCTQFAQVKTYSQYLLQPKTESHSNHIEQEKIYRDFYERQFKIPAQVVLDVSNTFKSLQKDWIYEDGFQTISYTEKQLNDLESIRRHASHILAGTVNIFDNLSKQSQSNYCTFVLKMKKP